MVVKAVNTLASLLNRWIDVGREYFKENGMAIAILLAIVYCVRSRYPKSRRSEGFVLSSSSESSIARNLEDRKIDREDKMRQVRQRQQQASNESAKEAAIKRKEKEAKERKRKNHIAKNNDSGAGKRLGGNHMDRSNTTSYRPKRRTPPGT
mmetsp:Transcript_1663/g.4294  ORF Transcript_1663/g.4294 Transcript_1663/m.4294 type:complete len:151 (-) Transcript_1663:393-845(-)